MSARPQVFLVRRLANGGMERVLLEQARAARESGPVRILALEDPGPLAPRFRDAGLEVEALGLPAAAAGALAGLPRLRAALRALRPGLLQVHQRRTGFLGRLAAWGLDLTPVVALHNEDPPAPAALRPLERALDRGARFLAVSDAVARHARRQRGLAAGAVEVIPNALPAASPRPGRRRGPPRVGFLGKLEEKKGPDLFLDALAALPPRARGWRVALGGDGPLRGALERRVLRERSPVRLVGEVPDGAAFLAGLDLACFPSRREGFGLAVGEALAAGVPVLLADIPAFREVYRELPEESFLAPDAGPRPWAAALERWVEDGALRSAQRRAARACLARHGPEEAAARYRAFYAGLREGAPLRTARAW